MKRMKIVRGVLVAVSCFGLATPQFALAVGPAATQNNVAYSSSVPDAAAPIVQTTDVALGEGGVLKGQIVSGDGAALAHTQVAVLKDSQAVAMPTTDADGYFAVAGLSGGIYQIVVGETTATYRAWEPNTAPPAAHNDILVVYGSNLVRGQGPVLSMLANPWVIAGVVATAVVVPVVVANDKDEAS
jgi:hypothetical protein